MNRVFKKLTFDVVSQDGAVIILPVSSMSQNFFCLSRRLYHKTYHGRNLRFLQ
jgi:hypothetical protein